MIRIFIAIFIGMIGYGLTVWLIVCEGRRRKREVSRIIKSIKARGCRKVLL